MSSIRFDGVRFRVFSLDHPPPHAHGYYASTTAVAELGSAGDISIRRGSVQPSNAKRSDIRRIVDAAAAHYAELRQMWEETHGEVG